MKSMMKATPNVARDLWEYAVEYVEAVSTVQQRRLSSSCTMIMYTVMYANHY